MYKSQTTLIGDRLKEGKEVTNVWAVNNRILRGAARIADLRKAGWKIGGHFLKDRKGKTTKVFEYYLIGEASRESS